MHKRIERLGEDALLLRIGERIDAGLNQRVHALAARIARQRPAWLRDLVPGYASLALFVDTMPGHADSDPLSAAEHWLRQQALIDDDGHVIDAPDTPDDAPHADSPSEKLVEIPVVYGGPDGPDLDDVAAHAGLSPQALIQRHCAPEYRVAMLGFAPGFPYLIGLDPALAMPRMETPRLRVAAGSVGIAGCQTGIYPRQGPGGWRIIGRTHTSLFDPLRTPSAALAPGDRLRFVAAADTATT